MDERDAPVAPPLRCSAPVADLGVVGGVRVFLLTIDHWASGAILRAAFLGEGSWLDEAYEPLGRWDLTTASWTIAASISGAGGSDELCFADVDLPSIDEVPSGATFTLHRFDQHASVVLDHVPSRSHRLGSASIDRRPPADDADDGSRCSHCGRPVPERRAGCLRCGGVLREVHEARAGAMPELPVIVPLTWAVQSRWKGAVTFLSLDRWAGWFELRYHLDEAWEATTGGLRGAWTAADGRSTFAGFEASSSGHAHGWTGRVAFPGTLDPAASALSVAIDRAGVVLLQVDLPLT